MKRLIGAMRVVGLVSGMEVLLLLLLITGPSILADGHNPPADATREILLPVVHYGFTPTPFATPPFPASPYEALVQITPTGGINASTFNRDSFIVRNLSSNEQKIEEVRIDLSTAVFPDMVFDPYGQGGDTLAKDLRVDYHGGTDLNQHRYEGEHGGGFDALILNFTNFSPGKEFRFSVDVDPNSIRGVGAPGPNESGSVSGLELAGSTITVSFGDGKELMNQTFRIPGSDSGSEAVLREGLPPSPQLTVENLGSETATVSTAAQSAIVTGPAQQPTTLLVLEGGLFLDGVPNGGFNLQPYDANSLVAVHEYPGTTFYNGSANIPVMLTARSPQAGINHLIAAFDNFYGASGPLSEPVKLHYIP